jgi:hypothetical protein
MEKCSICLEHLLHEQSQKTTTCNHTFHQTCLDIWIQEHTTCPLCRQNIPGCAIQIPQLHISQEDQRLISTLLPEVHERSGSVNYINPMYARNRFARK